jgi:hypothetical protein
VRLQDRDHDGAGVSEESRLKRQGTAHKTRHQSLRRQDSLHHQPVSTVGYLDSRSGMIMQGDLIRVYKSKDSIIEAL